MDFTQVRTQFPTLAQTLNGYPLCYLDTAATSHKPHQVLEAMTQFYRNTNANVHRAAHQLSSQATREYEAVRDQVMHFIHAKQREEIIFTHGTTEAINMVANGLVHSIRSGQYILIDSLAHHANIVPWQVIAAQTGAIIKPIPLTAEGRLDTVAYEALLSHNPAIVALSHVSNALGVLNPIETLIQKAKAVGAITLVDGAQAVAHLDIDVQQIGCDFYAFSGHKMYGPTGIGVLYGRFHKLDSLTPLITGGEMIKSVTFKHTEYNVLPNRLEAGTPPIAEVIGLGAAISFLTHISQPKRSEHEISLLHYLQNKLSNLEGITLYGAHSDNVGAVAFNLHNEHHQDVGALLDQQAIAIRCGHHCAMPLMQILNIKGCCRASIGIYTNKQDIDHFIDGLKTVQDMLYP
ncbi:aminotransferase class V-fold PLP-dependent enzyme [uncultured Shewanella sp.]|uniref:aminotransferase class V-fold PLP-dependent enzyme n=1 Tax=uncultured Shewanella sp. TaxID=173975 RepID=UPI002634609B|nr:cysteine desulfurase [uncultured Shewanella sp.]